MSLAVTMATGFGSQVEGIRPDGRGLLEARDTRIEYGVARCGSRRRGAFSAGQVSPAYGRAPRCLQ
jgi:hypothetical protein